MVFIPIALFGFLSLTLVDVLDILLVALLIFVAIRWIKGSSAMSIFAAIISLYLVRFIASALNMRLISSLLGTLLDVGVIALIVIFQPEIRRFLIKLGDRYRKMSDGSGLINKIFGTAKSDMGRESVEEITEACRSMSAEKTGALIVIPGDSPLNDIIETGDRIDARISRRLIMNLFFKNSPLHDGAVIIDGLHIVAARCTLPITEKTDIPANFGMRHKAAIGVTENTDAQVIVVSEETGRISYVKDGIVTAISNINELKLILNDSYIGDTEIQDARDRDTERKA